MQVISTNIWSDHFLCQNCKAFLLVDENDLYPATRSYSETHLYSEDYEELACFKCPICDYEGKIYVPTLPQRVQEEINYKRNSNYENY
jgi:hypothetical protein